MANYNYLSFHLVLHAALIRYAEIRLRRRPVVREVPTKIYICFYIDVVLDVAVLIAKGPY